MRILFLCVLYSLVFDRVFSQTDTLFLDELNQNAISRKAPYYAVFTREEDNWYKVEKYRADTTPAILLLTTHSLRSDTLICQGPCVWYYQDGKRSAEGAYKTGKMTGTWTHYRQTGEVWYVMEQEMGTLRSYYKSGRLKREEQQEDGKVTGKCYTETGAEMKFTPFMVSPRPPIKIPKYLSRHLPIPSYVMERLEGRIVLKFRVDELGNIHNVRVVRSVSEDIDEMARRVIATMPKWKPGKSDDVPTTTDFMLPIRFQSQ